MEWIETLGLPAVFLAGLLEFAGVPFPGAPLLIASGALSGTGAFSPFAAWAAAATGAILADQVWYHLARARGQKLLATACRISVNPTACLCQTHGLLNRFGAPALLFTKFIPGVSALFTPVAAVGGVPPGRFSYYSSLGSMLWAGVWIGVGAFFHEPLTPLVEAVFTWAPRALLVLAGLALLLLTAKVLAGWWAVYRDPHPEGAHPQNPFHFGGRLDV